MNTNYCDNPEVPISNGIINTLDGNGTLGSSIYLFCYGGYIALNIDTQTTNSTPPEVGQCVYSSYTAGTWETQTEDSIGYECQSESDRIRV